MSQVRPETTDLPSQYAAQLTADLERNAKERERISAEAAALDEQLRALQRDQAVLVSLQQALSGKSSSAKNVAKAPSVPRQGSAEGKAARKRKTAAGKSPKTAAGSSSGKASAVPALPTLVELIRNHLIQESEPRSVSEITTALAETHPERGIKVTVVRTTVEGLVARGRVQRTKQGAAVFYTAAATDPADDRAEQSDQVTV